MSPTLQLAEQLIARPSVTPNDAGCLAFIALRFTPLGFVCERMDSGPESFRVHNLWAIRRSNAPGAQTLLFADHTDVVPAGPAIANRRSGKSFCTILINPVETRD